MCVVAVCFGVRGDALAVLEGLGAPDGRERDGAGCVPALANQTPFDPVAVGGVDEAALADTAVRRGEAQDELCVLEPRR